MRTPWLSQVSLAIQCGGLGRRAFVDICGVRLFTTCIGLGNPGPDCVSDIVHSLSRGVSAGVPYRESAG